MSTNSYTSNLVQFYIRPFGSEERYLIKGYTVKNLLEGTPLIDWEQELHRYPHLKKGNPVKSEPGDKYGVLLGTEHKKLMLSDAKIEGPENEPDVERTKLGWAISGIIKDVQMPN